MICLSGPQLRNLAEYYGELLEEGDRLEVRREAASHVAPTSDAIAVTAVYADGSRGITHVFPV